MKIRARTGQRHLLEEVYPNRLWEKWVGFFKKCPARDRVS